MSRQSKYFWPASAITEADMALLYQARKVSMPKVPISQLIAIAIRQVHAQGNVLTLPFNSKHQDVRKTA